MEDNGGHSFTEGMDPVHFTGKEITTSERLRNMAAWFKMNPYPQWANDCEEIADTLDSLEISDGEIESNSVDLLSSNDTLTDEAQNNVYHLGQQRGAMWYREQMRNKLK